MDRHRTVSAECADEGDADWSCRRADARRNHERVIAAAVQVFAERGLAATVPEVAARAGVGKATVYRSYPTKSDLVDAVLAHQYDRLEKRIAAALTEPDPDRALDALIPDLFAQMAANRLHIELMNEKVQHGARTLELLGALMEEAKARGRLRPDATIADLKVLMGGVAKKLADLGDDDPARWRRYGEFVLAALRR